MTDLTKTLTHYEAQARIADLEAAHAAMAEALHYAGIALASGDKGVSPLALEKINAALATHRETQP
jgi:hypothetical protein